MKYAFVAAALVASVSAQSISDIPACAIPCIDASRTKVTTCSETDYACLCDNITAIQGDATTCVITDCGADVAVSQVLPATQAFCAAVEAGGSSSSTAASTTSSAAETTAAPTSTVASTTETVAPTTETSVAVTTSAGYSASTPEGTTTVGTSTTYKPTTVVSSTTKHSNGTTSATTAPVTVPTGGAAIATAGSVGMLVLGGLVALL